MNHVIGYGSKEFDTKVTRRLITLEHTTENSYTAFVGIGVVSSLKLLSAQCESSVISWGTFIVILLPNSRITIKWVIMSTKYEVIIRNRTTTYLIPNACRILKCGFFMYIVCHMKIR